MITSGRKDADWLPHGLWLDKFHATTKPEGPEVTVGSVMANQARKDYPTAFGCFAVLRQRYGNLFHAWLHTDTLMGYWNVPAMAADYGITDCLECTISLSDDQLALRYSACDCTILPSGGEGFGYPIAESLACGTAPIVTNYAAGAELAPALCRVDPVAYRVDTQHNVLRAVLSGSAFADAAEAQIDLKREDWEYRPQELAAAVAHLDWNKLKYPWMGWLKEGL
jgi:glycosyltransferase involved in cell wall biosynthesis